MDTSKRRKSSAVTVERTSGCSRNNPRIIHRDAGNDSDNVTSSGSSVTGTAAGGEKAKETEVIATERLRIRRICPEDWKAVQAVWIDESLSAYANFDRIGDLDDETVISRIQKWSMYSKSDEHLFYAVCLQDSVIGYVTFHRREDGYEIGYCFHSDHHGKGYARESISALLEVMKMKGASVVTAGTAQRNLPSVKLLTSLGFRQTGTEKVSFYKDKEGRDIVFDGGIYELPL